MSVITKKKFIEILIRGFAHHRAQQPPQLGQKCVCLSLMSDAMSYVWKSLLLLLIFRQGRLIMPPDSS